MAKSKKENELIMCIDIKCPNCRGLVPCAGSIRSRELSELECIYCGHKFGLVKRVREKLNKGFGLLRTELKKICKTL